MKRLLYGAILVPMAIGLLLLMVTIYYGNKLLRWIEDRI